MRAISEDIVACVAPAAAWIPLATLSSHQIVTVAIIFCVCLLLAVIGSVAQEKRRRRQTQTTRQQREDRYHSMIEETSDIIHIVSPEGKFLYTNRAWCRTLGYSLEEIPRLTLMEILHPDERARAQSEIGQLMAEKGVSEIEIRFLTKDGRTIWVEGNSTCELADGEVVARRGIFRDTTARKRAEAERSRLLVILEQAPDFIGTFTPDGTVLWINRAFRNLRGLPEKCDFSGLKISDFHPNSATQVFAQAVAIALKSGIWKGESALVGRDGRDMPVSHTIMAHRDDSGNIAYLSTLCRDITESRLAEEALREAHSQIKVVLQREKELARTDMLTGLANRRAFHESLQMERARSARYGRPITLAYVDLDNFKRVNDALGHSVGDELLVCVADRLRQTLRSSDTVGRLGGDEFALLLPETDAPSAETLLQKLRGILMGAMQARNWPVTFSIGAACFIDNPPQMEHMIRTADELMYTVKRSGKDRITVVLLGGTPFDPAMEAALNPGVDSEL